ncbi:DTW domain containing protein [Cryptosporidium felis]|nr:DTW domain containing protein [Cryptosporidium felis]
MQGNEPYFARALSGRRVTWRETTPDLPEGDKVEFLEGEVNSLNLEDLEPKERYSAVVKRRIEKSVRDLERKERQEYEFVKCRSCFLVKKHHCICSELSELAEKVRSREAYPEVRFIILMNDREFFRSSNTGKLVRALIPESEILIHGVPEDLERLRRTVLRDPEVFRETVVLYPGRGSKSVREFLEEQLLGAPETDPPSKDLRKKVLDLCKRLRLQVILIDGTWHQAKSINKSIPSCITRIAINSKLVSDFGPLRKQNKECNVSTVEAAALFLRDLGGALASWAGDGESSNSEGLTRRADLLSESLDVLISSVIAQCKREYIFEVLKSRNEKRFGSSKGGQV